ncbi:haloacid dehalogenase type II [Pelagibius sp. Alg239-R121]|uniref:haloacid dehalogenase type II n=1 Tax=Pelagibius sp. Alg239-R121 TaxID=2993448 RepID=UPI0024A6305F|nr:haloacid dehalogenase type II [Pelagibius sp. Alg239-R121]
MSHPDFSSVEACVFDAYGTLFNVHSAVARGGERLGEKADAVSNTWRQKQLEYTWLRSLMGAHADFWQVTSDGLDYALEAHGVEDKELHANLMDLYLTLEAYDDVRPTLQKLKDAGLKTGILSNGTPRMLEAAVTSAGIDNLLDENLSIEDVGIYKPDNRVYQLAVDRLSVAPDKICFVSTNAWDAAGAAHFGFNVAWLNRFSKIQEVLPGRPKAVINTLTDLSDLIGLGQ